MIYDEARDKIASGDMLAWSHRKWASWYDFKVQMVRMFTRSEFSHVAVAWRIGGRLFVIEAVSEGIRIFPLSRLLPFYWIPLNLKWSNKVETFALSKVGEPYSQFRAILAYFRLIKIGKDKHWECAEFVLAILKKAGRDYTRKYLATPIDAVDAVQSDGYPLYLIDN